jgi:glyoxylase-like metal-dependent hydrolase (beta-lactamase superfamily II)/rhodanese-related sulfurtransferase
MNSFYIEQLYTGCLAQGAYYVESDGVAAIIDPLRDTRVYEERAHERNAQIRYILETHFHADFVSGHLDLAAKTGAPIVFGPLAKPEYAIHSAADGEILSLGNVSIKVLHTPGHTMESTCYLLLDEHQQPRALFSGDTLFIGDVGRPDLAAKSDLSVSDLASHLFDSLRTKIMVLPDDVVVYPAHGAGSACGKNMSKETTDTLGNQKKTNYALNAALTREQFIAEVTEGLLPPPGYFPENVRMNKQGYHSLDVLKEKGLRALSAIEVEQIGGDRQALVLDVRSPQAFTDLHIPGSISIGLDGQFAPWVGALIPDIMQPLILIAEPGREEEALTRLARVGYDGVLGYLDGGLDAWQKAGFETDSVANISALQLKEMPMEALLVVDVRKPGEFISSHIPTAVSAPLEDLNAHLSVFSSHKTHYLHCAGGYRSVIAASILKSRGIHNLVNVLGGFSAIKEAGIAVSQEVCPTTLK